MVLYCSLLCCCSWSYHTDHTTVSCTWTVYKTVRPRFTQATQFLCNLTFPLCVDDSGARLWTEVVHGRFRGCVRRQKLNSRRSAGYFSALQVQDPACDAFGDAHAYHRTPTLLPSIRQTRHTFCISIGILCGDCARLQSGTDSGHTVRLSETEF